MTWFFLFLLLGFLHGLIQPLLDLVQRERKSGGMLLFFISSPWLEYGLCSLEGKAWHHGWIGAMIPFWYGGARKFRGP